jgi:hypothetical protein
MLPFGGGNQWTHGATVPWHYTANQANHGTFQQGNIVKKTMV